MTLKTADIWWLNPALVFAASGVGIGIAAYAIPESLYRSYWRTPKFFDETGLAITLGCVAVFVFGAVLGSSLTSRRQAPRDWETTEVDLPEGLLKRLFQCSFWLCVIGYLLWGGLAVQRGMSASVVFGVLTGEEGAMYDARFTYLPTVGGVTTLTQFGTAAVILGAILGCQFGWRKVAPKLLLVFAFALGRVLINSERFALLELVIPLMVVVLGLRYIGSRRIPASIRAVVAVAPAFGVAALFLLFTGFEYFRSWSNYYAGRDHSLLEFGALRLLGYYVTAFNNGAYLLQTLDPLNAPYFTLHCLWRFPLTAPLFARLFPDPIFDSADKWFYFSYIDSGANLEFNNGDGMLFPMMDFGIPAGLIYWLFAGAACGVLYRLYCRKAHAGLLLYPVVFLGLLEAPLALYWAEGRAFPSICMLILSAALISFSRHHRKFRENSANAARELQGASWAQ